MDDVTEKKNAEAVAAKVRDKAEEALRPLEYMVSKWPADFRAIMWIAVADLANKRRCEADALTHEIRKPDF